MDGVEIEDLDLENFDDFEEVDNGLQDAQEQWPEEIDFSPQDIPVEEENIVREEEETATTCSDDTSPACPVSRTVGEKWRPPSAPEAMTSPDGTNLPGLGVGKRSKVSQSVGDCYEPPEPFNPHSAGSTSLRNTPVASVKPTSAVAPSGSVRSLAVLNLQQAADLWMDNPLINVKVCCVYVYVCFNVDVF